MIEYKNIKQRHKIETKDRNQDHYLLSSISSHYLLYPCIKSGPIILELDF